MNGQEQHTLDFFRDNLVLIGIVVLAIFGYLVLIVRNRWKRNFLHRDENKEKQKE